MRPILQNFSQLHILATQAVLKGPKKTGFFNWYWYVINGKKGIRGGISCFIYWYAKN